jgi:flagellin-like hook-associated protein FlgL
VKQQIKIESSNDIYGTSSKVKSAEDIAEYDKYLKEMNMKKQNSNGSLFNGLNSDVAVIDFNSGAGPSFKMPRSYDLSMDEENAAKRRRFKMIPNSNAIPGEMNGSKLQKVSIEYWMKDYPPERTEFLEAVS